MQRYILRRLMLTVPTLIGVTLLVSALLYALPGDTVTMMMADYGGYAKDLDDMRAKLGLNRSFPEQYLSWLGQVAQGNLGKALRDQSSIGEEMAKRLPVTIELGIIGLAVALIISIPLGVYSAVKQDHLSDYIARSAAIGMVAIPGFWLGTLAITMPAIWWGWTPPLRYTQLIDDPGKNLLQMLLPGVILGIGISGALTRLTRGQMLEVLRQDFVRTARSKGLAEPLIVYGHALKNALIPVVTLLGLQVSVLVSGTVVLENIFVVPGMGRWLITAITERDYPTVQAIVLVFSVVILASNLVVDILYAWLDPRIRYS